MNLNHFLVQAFLAFPRGSEWSFECVLKYTDRVVKGVSPQASIDSMSLSYFFTIEINNFSQLWFDKSDHKIHGVRQNGWL